MLAINIKTNIHIATKNDSEDNSYRIAAEGRKSCSITSCATEAYAKLKIGNKIAQIVIHTKTDTGAMSKYNF